MRSRIGGVLGGAAGTSLFWASLWASLSGSTSKIGIAWSPNDATYAVDAVDVVDVPVVASVTTVVTVVTVRPNGPALCCPTWPVGWPNPVLDPRMTRTGLRSMGVLLPVVPITSFETSKISTDWAFRVVAKSRGVTGSKNTAFGDALYSGNVGDVWCLMSNSARSPSMTRVVCFSGSAELAG